MARALEVGQWNVGQLDEHHKKHLLGWYREGICGAWVGQDDSGWVTSTTVYYADLVRGAVPKNLCKRCVKIATN